MLRLALGLLLLVAVRPETRSAPVAGTYAVWLCTDACGTADTARAPVAGYLVLGDGPLSLEPLDADARKRLLNESAFFLWSPDRGERAGNACFSLSPRADRSGMLAGITRASVTAWESRGDTIEVGLYASPDAFYTLRAIVREGRLVGSGRESGYIGRPFDNESGTVHGIRVGPPDVTRCTPPARSR